MYIWFIDMSFSKIARKLKLYCKSSKQAYK